MKSILFVINTMGMGGGERALLELLRQIDMEEYEVSLFVLTGQGELIEQIPKKVKLLNERYFPVSVLDSMGKWRLFRTIIAFMFVRGTIFKRAGYIAKNLKEMIRERKIQKDKLLWKIISDGAPRFEKKYDLAVAYLEGASAYYVDSYVKAERKAAFIHIDYKLAGYNRSLDENCYLHYDKIFAVSESAKKIFLSVYPECEGFTGVFYDLVDRGKIIRDSRKEGGFSDQYNGFRILTVGRLVPQKAIDIAIETMKILKDTSKQVRWYVLGEGELRKKLENKICMLGLDEDFVLLGTVSNPYPYYEQCDLYVHTALFEGRGSIAIEEAQILGCAVVAAEHDGIWEQIEDGIDGIVCRPDPKALAEEILDLVEHPQKRAAYGKAASKREQADKQSEIEKLIGLL